MHKNLIAIGRSELLHATIRHLHAQGFGIKGIITDSANAEYGVNQDNFKQLAYEIGAEYLVAKSIDPEILKSWMEASQVRLGISVNWKYTISELVLNLFPLGILNYHLGNLPDYKGNATVNWAILQGEKFIHGNVHKMAAQLDAGDIISRAPIAIHEDTYVGDILAEARHQAPLLFEEAINQLIANESFVLEKGSTEGLRCYPRLPEDGCICWEDAAVKIHRLVRASAAPYPGAFTYWRGSRAIIWKASLMAAPNKWLAIPGHILEINKADGTIVVATGSGLIRIEEMEIDGERGKPTLWCKSIRERFRNRPQINE